MSSSKDRQKIGYLTPKNFLLFEALQKSESMGDSEAINYILNKFFETISPRQRMIYLNKAKAPQDLASWPV